MSSRVRGILVLGLSLILMFTLLQIVQSSGINQGGGVQEGSQNPFFGGGFGQQGLLTLQVDVQLTEDIEPYFTPLGSQLVEIYWEGFDIDVGGSRTLSVSSRTDDRGRALFRISPGNYTIRVDYNGIDANATVIIPDGERFYTVNWIIDKKTLSSYRLEFKDTRGDGIVLSGEKVTMIYESAALVDDPRVVELRVSMGPHGETRKVTSLRVTNFINVDGKSIIVMTPIEPFIVSNFNPSNPPTAAIYSIKVGR